MKKPSLKNKLTADKIEEANRLLSSQNAVSKMATPKVESIAPTDADIDDSTHSKTQKSSTVNKSKVPSKPSTASVKTKQSSKNMVSEQQETGRLVRVTVDIPENLHEKLKIKMILSKQTIKDYLLNFIEKDLAKSEYKF